MSNYIYSDGVGAGPAHPLRRWGLFSTELTEAEARARYELNAVNRREWFGIVRLDDAGQPVSYLQMCPRANGVVLEKINRHSTVEVSYGWVAYYDPEDGSTPYDGDQDSVFLTGITWYSYRNDKKHYARNESVGRVMMQFVRMGMRRRRS